MPVGDRCAEGGRIAPCGDPFMGIPNTNLPGVTFDGFERATRIDNALRLIRLDPTGIPDNLSAGIRDLDLIGRLILVLAVGNFLPTQAGLCRADSFRIGAVFASQSGNRCIGVLGLASEQREG